MPTAFGRDRWLVFTSAAITRFIPIGISITTAGACSLAVHVDGFRNDKGVIGAAVFKSPDGWPENDRQAFTRNAVPVPGNSRAVLTFPDIPPGRYGIVVLHDENKNHRLDRNLFRVPKEGFGFANNPHVGLAAPSWRESSIEVVCPATEVDIHLIYK
jgi:uncharacterized protein (DUF2141 family)